MIKPTKWSSSRLERHFLEHKPPPRQLTPLIILVITYWVGYKILRLQLPIYLNGKNFIKISCIHTVISSAPKSNALFVSLTSRPAKNISHHCADNFRSYQQNAYNCPYHAMVKNSFKNPVSTSWSVAPTKSNHLLLVTQPNTPKKFHQNLSTFRAILLREKHNLCGAGNNNKYSWRAFINSNDLRYSCIFIRNAPVVQLHRSPLMSRTQLLIKAEKCHCVKWYFLVHRFNFLPMPTTHIGASENRTQVWWKSSALISEHPVRAPGLKE